MKTRNERRRQQTLSLCILIASVLVGTASAQQSITGSTVLGRPIPDTVTSPAMGLSDVIGDRTLNLEFLTLDGESNRISVDTSMFNWQMDLDDSSGELMVDLKLVELGVRQEPGSSQSAAVVRVEFAGKRIELLLYFEPGMSAITGSAAIRHEQPVPYAVHIEDKRTGERRAWRGIAGLPGDPTLEKIAFADVQIEASTSSMCAFREIEDGLLAEVRDRSQPWHCVVGSEKVRPVAPGEDFLVEFEFNPIQPDWGHYPAIYFVDSSLGRPGRGQNTAAFRFSIDWADRIVRKFRLHNSERYIETPTIPASDEWYRVRIQYKASTQRAHLIVFRENGELFFDRAAFFPITGDFDQALVGEIQGGTKYGNRAAIGLRRLALRRDVDAR